MIYDGRNGRNDGVFNFRIDFRVIVSPHAHGAQLFLQPLQIARLHRQIDRELIRFEMLEMNAFGFFDV